MCGIVGLFVWAVSFPDAYRIARIRYEKWQHGQRVASRENSLHAS